jgi:hypothetical protein
VPPDQTKATRCRTSSGESVQALRKSQRIGKRREAAGEVVGAAIALCLADQGDDLGGIDLTLVNEALQSGNVVGTIHWQLVYADPQGTLPVAKR